MMRSRAAIVTVIAILLAAGASVANPGGNGDGNRDYTCGGSCHGDPALSSPSDGTVSVSVDSTTYTGTATAVHVTASGMRTIVALSSIHRSLGHSAAVVSGPIKIAIQ